MSFRDSREAIFRRIVRGAIRKSDLTKSEKAVTLALANIWFHHHAKGEMHPGRAKIARREQVSIKTVTRTMAKLREAGCLVIVSHPNGGRTATRYRLRTLRLMEFCGVDLPDVIEGQLTRFSGRNVPLSSGEMSRFTGDKMSHGISTVSTDDEDSEVEPFLRVIGGRDV